MPRTRNESPTEIIRFPLPHKSKLALKELLPKGIYGKTVPEIAERLISEKIRELIREGALVKR